MYAGGLRLLFLGFLKQRGPNTGSPLVLSWYFGLVILALRRQGRVFRAQNP